MITNIDEVKKLNQERLRESNREKAEKYESESRAERINSLNAFKALHSGYQAVQRNSVYLSCEANDKALLDLLEKEQLSVTLETLEHAFEILTKSGSLAQFSKQQQKYDRKTNTAESRIAPQQKSFGQPPLALPYTRDEVLSWSKDRLKQEVSKSPRHLAAVNRILAGQN